MKSVIFSCIFGLGAQAAPFLITLYDVVPSSMPTPTPTVDSELLIPIGTGRAGADTTYVDEVFKSVYTTTTSGAVSTVTMDPVIIKGIVVVSASGFIKSILPTSVPGADTGIIEQCNIDGKGGASCSKAFISGTQTVTTTETGNARPVEYTVSVPRISTSSPPMPTNVIQKDQNVKNEASRLVVGVGVCASVIVGGIILYL